MVTSSAFTDHFCDVLISFLFHYNIVRKKHSSVRVKVKNIGRFMQTQTKSLGELEVKYLLESNKIALAINCRVLIYSLSASCKYHSHSAFAIWSMLQLTATA